MKYLRTVRTNKNKIVRVIESKKVIPFVPKKEYYKLSDYFPVGLVA
jgi:hypothetical protein